MIDNLTQKYYKEYMNHDIDHKTKLFKSNIHQEDNLQYKYQYKVIYNS